MKKIIPIILGIVLLASCSDNYLDRLPETTIGESQEFFNSESGLQTYSNVFYSYINWGSVTNDMSSDNCEHATSPASIHRGDIWTLPTAQGSNGWSWTQLRTINYFLEKVEASTVSEDVKVQYRALARFFRALFYFDKVKAFGDVPWYDQVIGSQDETLLFKGRDPRETVMNNVLTDLNYACDNLPAQDFQIHSTRMEVKDLPLRRNMAEVSRRQWQYLPPGGRQCCTADHERRRLQALFHRRREQ